MVQQGVERARQPSRHDAEWNSAGCPTSASDWGDAGGLVQAGAAQISKAPASARAPAPAPAPALPNQWVDLNPAEERLAQLEAARDQNSCPS